MKNVAKKIQKLILRAQQIHEESYYNYGQTGMWIDHGYDLDRWDAARLAAQELGYGPGEAYITYLLMLSAWNDIQDPLPTTWD